MVVGRCAGELGRRDAMVDLVLLAVDVETGDTREEVVRMRSFALV